MKVVNGVANLNEVITSSAVTIGSFDGVHLGHQALFQTLMQQAHADQKKVVFTFDPHPAAVLSPSKRPPLLFPRHDQLEQFEKFGFEYAIVEPFSRAFSQLSPLEFLNNWVFKPLSPKVLVVGYDFAFGANREGNAEFLAQQCQLAGVEFHRVQPFRWRDQIVSSTKIRKLIFSGEVAEASQLLGRPFYIEGLVEKGDQRGRRLGFPTANLHTSTEVVPPKGVYAGWVVYRSKRWPAVTNVGTNPTFTDSEALKVESHLIGVEIDLYGEELRFEFIERIRAEKKFNSIDELKIQIQDDVQHAHDILKK